MLVMHIFIIQYGTCGCFHDNTGFALDLRSLGPGDVCGGIRSVRSGGFPGLIGIREIRGVRFCGLCGQNNRKREQDRKMCIRDRGSTKLNFALGNAAGVIQVIIGLVLVISINKLLRTNESDL